LFVIILYFITHGYSKDFKATYRKLDHYSGSEAEFAGGFITNSQTRNWETIFNALVLIFIAGKLLYFIRVSDSLRLQSTLILMVCSALIPFLTLFWLAVVFFALMQLILGSNHHLAAGYDGLGDSDGTIIFAYIVQAFENGIGHLKNPTINFLANP